MSKGKILVADDDKSTRELISIVLEDEGYDVITAINGIETIDKTVKEKPDLIVLDIMMPQMDGYEALNKIKENEEIARIPILVITARTIKIYEKISKGLGAVDHITKPFSPDELLDKIKSILK
ncbi:PleD family two-component system response regulator [candidate division CSSED10-310 bacterium]|uniref:PleD family two-component system response regulator n=1 Tax=candidate division CSSED10-310 bacterium TaxID=2855610 RepID=A0ABV6Z6L1_UNCC1